MLHITLLHKYFRHKQKKLLDSIKKGRSHVRTYENNSYICELTK